VAHPRMYEEGDPGLAEMRRICLDLPEATEVESWGRPTFRAKKIFATFGVPSEDRSHGMVFKPDEDERPALLQDERFFAPPYWGPGGWLALDFDAAPVDWDEVAELVEGSYRQVALKRMLKALDERTS
jgi:hypothetical protein